MTREIKFGWFIPPQDDWGAGDFFEVISERLAQIHDKFDSVWVPDHFHPPDGDHDDARGVPECMTTMAYIAGAFPRLDMGSIVLCQSYRNPALLAKMGATLQALSGGRFILGIGAGWKVDEYLAYDYPFPPTTVRMEQLAEAIQIIKAMWRDSPASFEGQHYHVRDAYCEPRPDPLPPIMVGGGGERLTLRIVAEHADWWNFIFGDVQTYAHKLSVLRKHCETVGRKYDDIVKTWADVLFIAETEAEARRLMSAGKVSVDWSPVLVGTPDQITEKLRPFVELGVEHFMFQFGDYPSPKGMKLFAEEVIPRFR